MQTFLLYIDPGSGSYLVQALVAAVLGVAFAEVADEREA